MEIGVLSDTHLTSVTDVLMDIIEHRFADADLIVHAGDVGSSQVRAYLEGHGAVLVRGNMDGPDLADLPTKRVVTADGRRIGVIHGWGAPGGLVDRIRHEFDDVDCVVFGHSHTPYNQKHGGVLYFNPGSASSARSGGGPSVGRLSVGTSITGRIEPIRPHGPK